MNNSPTAHNHQETNTKEDDKRSPTSTPFPVMQPMQAITAPMPRNIGVNNLPSAQTEQSNLQNTPNKTTELNQSAQQDNPIELMNEFFGISAKLSMHQNLEFIDETSNKYYLNFDISPQLDTILNKVRKNFILKLVSSAKSNSNATATANANSKCSPWSEPESPKEEPFLPIAVECVNEFVSSGEINEIYKQSSDEFVSPERVENAVKYSDVKKYEFDLYKIFNRLLHFINTRVGGIEIMMVENGVFLINFSAGLSLTDQINGPVRGGFNSAVFNFQLMFVAIFIGIVNNLFNSIGFPNFIEIEPHVGRMAAKLKINFSSVIFEKNIPLASRCDVLSNIKALVTPISEKSLTYHVSVANLDGLFNFAPNEKATETPCEGNSAKKTASPLVVDARGNPVDARTHTIVKTLMVSYEEFNALTEKIEQTVASFNKLILNNSFTSILFLNTQSYKVSLTDISRLLGTTALDVFNDPKYSYVLSLFSTFYGINSSFISNCQMKCFHRFELMSKFEPKIDTNVVYTLGENHTKFNKLFEHMNEKTNNFSITNTVGPLIAVVKNSNKTHILVKQTNEEYSIDFLCEKFVYLKIAIYMFMHAIVLNMPPVYVEVRELAKTEPNQYRPLSERGEKNRELDDSLNFADDSLDTDELSDSDDEQLEESSRVINDPSEYISVSVEPVISTELKPTDICSLEPGLLSITLDFLEKLMKMCIGIDAEICDIAISRRIDSIVHESIMTSAVSSAMKEYLPIINEMKRNELPVQPDTTALDFKKFVENLAKNIEIVEGRAIYKNYKSSTI